MVEEQGLPCVSVFGIYVASEQVKLTLITAAVAEEVANKKQTFWIW